MTRSKKAGKPTVSKAEKRRLQLAARLNAEAVHQEVEKAIQLIGEANLEACRADSPLRLRQTLLDVEEALRDAARCHRQAVKFNCELKQSRVRVRKRRRPASTRER